MSFWLSVGVPIGGTALAGAAALGGVMLGRSGERDQWLRTERLRLYTEYHAVASQLCDEDKALADAALSSLTTLHAGLEMIGPLSVAKAARDWFAAEIELSRIDQKHDGPRWSDAYATSMKHQVYFLTVCAGVLGGRSDRVRARRMSRPVDVRRRGTTL